MSIGGILILETPSWFGSIVGLLYKTAIGRPTMSNLFIIMFNLKYHESNYINKVKYKPKLQSRLKNIVISSLGQISTNCRLYEIVSFSGLSNDTLKVRQCRDLRNKHYLEHFAK